MRRRGAYCCRPDFVLFLEKIAVAKSKRQQTTRQAYRTLVKHYVMPLRQHKVKKLDKFLGALLHPDVNDIITEYEPALKECYGIYSMMDEELGWEITWEMLEVRLSTAYHSRTTSGRFRLQ